jgi:Trk-type K+ transport system membrane component
MHLYIRLTSTTTNSLQVSYIIQLARSSLHQAGVLGGVGLGVRFVSATGNEILLERYYVMELICANVLAEVMHFILSKITMHRHILHS